MSVPAYKRKLTGMELLVNANIIVENIFINILAKIDFEKEGRKEVLTVLEQSIAHYSILLLENSIDITNIKKNKKENILKEALYKFKKEKFLLSIELEILYMMVLGDYKKDILNISYKLSNLNKVLLCLLENKSKK